MALAWRLADPRYAEDLEGSGNRVGGARWNSPGRGVLYCSETLALCVLETLVHLPFEMRDRLPPRLALRLEYPDDAGITDLAVLPGTPAACRERGDRWLADGKALVLRAPSIVVPPERNVMLNPLHRHFRKVRIVQRVAFAYDERLRHA